MPECIDKEKYCAEVCRKYDLRKVRPHCKKNRTPKVLTNADKIRSMTDEKLAEFLERCEGEGYQDSSITPIMENGYHVDMLEWLKQPAEEE